MGYASAVLSRQFTCGGVPRLRLSGSVMAGLSHAWKSSGLLILSCNKHFVWGSLKGKVEALIKVLMRLGVSFLSGSVFGEVAEAL